MMITQHPESASVHTPGPAAIPRPSRAVAPYGVAALLVAGAGAAGALGSRQWTALLVASLLGAAGAAVRAFIRRERVVSAADAWIADGCGSRPSAAVLRERSRALTAARHRGTIARSLQRIVRQPGQPPRRSAQVPLDSEVVRTCSAQLLRVATHLADQSQAVSPRGVVLAERLLTDPGSPIYRHAQSTSGALEERVRQTLFELERSL